MALIRDLSKNVKSSKHIVRGSRLLRVWICNIGTKNINVDGMIINPGKDFDTGASDIPFRRDFELEIDVTGSTKEENKYLLFITSLDEEHC